MIGDNNQQNKNDSSIISGAVDTVKDAANALVVRGGLNIADSVIGLADATTTAAGWQKSGSAVRDFLRNDDGNTLLTFDPQAALRQTQDWYSDSAKQAQQDFDNAKGVVEKTKVAVSNPFDLVLPTIAESVPSMFAGGVAGGAVRAGLMKAGVNGAKAAVAGGAVGEGLIAAGGAASQIQQETGGMTQGQSLAALGSGAATGLLGFLGGKVAQKLGVADVDSTLASTGGRSLIGNTAADQIKPQNVPLSVVKGAIAEGLLEELPQSLSEQLIQNLATGKDWHENLDGAAVLGAISGGVMGGAISGASAYADNKVAAQQQAIEQQQWAKRLEEMAQYRKDNLAAIQQENQAVSEELKKQSELSRLNQQHQATEKAVNRFEEKFGALPDTLALPSPELASVSTVVEQAREQALQEVSNKLFNRQKGEEREAYLARIQNQDNIKQYEQEVAEIEQRFSEYHSRLLNDVRNHAPVPTGNSEYEQLARAAYARPFMPPVVEPVDKKREIIEKMRLNPNAGTLSAAAVVAVDNGAAPITQALQQSVTTTEPNLQQAADTTQPRQYSALKREFSGSMAHLPPISGNIQPDPSYFAPDAMRKDANRLGNLLSNKPEYGLPAMRKVFAQLPKPVQRAFEITADYNADLMLRKQATGETDNATITAQYPQVFHDAFAFVRDYVQKNPQAKPLLNSLANAAVKYRRNYGWGNSQAAQQQSLEQVEQVNSSSLNNEQTEIEAITTPLKVKNQAVNVVDYMGRKITLININGVAVPFYRSTGLGGKKDVAAGKWYPFFGFGKQDGQLTWIIKTGGKGTKARPDLNMNDYYGSQVLKEYAEKLDRVYNDNNLAQLTTPLVDTVSLVTDTNGNPVKLPQRDSITGSLYQSKVNDFANQIIQAVGEPLSNSDVSAIEQRIDNIVQRVEQGNNTRLPLDQSQNQSPETTITPTNENMVGANSHAPAAAIAETTAQATADTLPELVSIQTTDGKTKRVSRADLDNADLTTLTTYSDKGKKTAVKLARSKIVQPEKQATQNSSSQSAVNQPQYTVIGKNSDGKTLYQDAKGVRYYEDGKFIKREPVRVAPSGETFVNHNTRRDEFKTVEEWQKDNSGSLNEANTQTQEQSNEIDPTHQTGRTEERRTGETTQSEPERLPELARDDNPTLERVSPENGTRTETTGDSEIQSSPSREQHDESLGRVHGNGDTTTGSTERSSSGTSATARRVEDNPRDLVRAAAELGKLEIVKVGDQSTQSETQVKEEPKQDDGKENSRDVAAVSGVSKSENDTTPAAGAMPEHIAPDFPPVENVSGSLNTQQDDFAIDNSDHETQGAKTKFKANIAAIETLKTLMQENRKATAEEQRILSKWVGWGGLANAFRRADGSMNKGWENETQQLEALLTDEELKSAAASTNTAFYTPSEVIKAMWAAVERMGFTGGRVLEPSVGAGSFIGLMSKGLRKSTAMHGTELDTITGNLAKKLYPTAKIQVMGFEDYTIPNGHFRLAIGNPPFGAWKITDKAHSHLNGLAIHNYFFAKSIDALEDNGVLAMVVTNNFMDASDRNDKARAYIAKNTELLAAVRLPNDAFQKNAGTSVTTDVIFLRKLTETERNTGKTVGHEWNATTTYTDKNGNQIPLNVYFANNPDMMLGEFGAFSGMYGGNTAALVSRKGQNTAQLLETALQKLPQNIFKQPEKDEVQLQRDMAKTIPEVKVGSLFVEEGRIYKRLPDELGEKQSERYEDLPSNETAFKRVAGMIEVREALARVRQLQLTQNVAQGVLNAARQKLNEVYDDFVKNYGYLNSQTNKNLFADDPSQPQLLALEDGYDKGISREIAKKTGQEYRKPNAKKAAIFTKRTQYPFAQVESVATAKDGLTESLTAIGRVDVPRIAKKYGKDESQVIEELGALIYNDPVYGWQTAEQYLSGNVKAKLAQAKQAAQENPAFVRNVQALQEVIPQDIEAADIVVRVGATWLPEKTMADFVRHLGVTLPENNAVSYASHLAEWFVSPNANYPANVQTQFGTSRKYASDIIQAALNGKTLDVYDVERINGGEKRTLNQEATAEVHAKIEDVKHAFEDWIWQDDTRREELSRIYNDLFNNTVYPQYNGSHLTLAGKIDDDVIALRPTQKNAVWRITQNQSTLLDHVVGAGKTFTMVAAAMELRRMGLATKPMIVVPNHLVGQWGKEFAQLYPNANILVAGKKDFEKNNRKKLVAKIANGDWDAVIVGHSSFGKVPVDEAYQAEFINNQISELMIAAETLRKKEGKGSMSAKEYDRRIKSLQAKYEKLTQSAQKDSDNLYWRELGVDALFVDEAHEFKNLAFVSSMQRVAGLGNQTGSQKAMDLYLKIQQMQEENNARVVFATGTPISNSMAEMYTMQRYLAENRLKEQGLTTFDAWARNFGEVVNDWELSPSGTYKMKSRFAKFVNMPELMQSYLSFADVINRDDINESLKAQGKTLPVPKIKGGKPENVIVPRSPFQAAYIGEPNEQDEYPENSLIWRSENLPKGEKAKEKGADNMLRIVGEARKLALDPRILDENAPDFEHSKINTAAQRIFEIYQKWDKEKGTQLVFSDLSTPKGAQAKERQNIMALQEKADLGDDDAAAALAKYSPDELDGILNANGFDAYNALKSKLMELGLPEKEIAFIHDANTDQQKAELFSKVKSGMVRVLIGSTSKMGAGTNVQNRLVALHHLDAPWRPSDLEQREGRIIRQGNELRDADPEHFEVEILRYATEKTMDAMQWQIIENKAKFIGQVRKGDTKSRVIEDIDGEAANAAQMKAASSGNPLILEEMSLRKQIQDLENDKHRHDKQQHRIKATQKQLTHDINMAQMRLIELDRLMSVPVSKDFDVKIGKAHFVQGQEKARENAGSLILREMNRGLMREIGTFGGFQLSAGRDDVGFNVLLSHAGASIRVAFESNANAGGVIMRLQNAIEKLPENQKALQNQIEQKQKSLPNLEKQLNQWDKGNELNALRERHRQVLNDLKPKNKAQNQANQETTQNNDDVALDLALSSANIRAFDVNVRDTIKQTQNALKKALGAENMRHIRVVSRYELAKLLPKSWGVDEIVKRSRTVRGLYRHSTKQVIVAAENFASTDLAVMTAWHELGHKKVALSGKQQWREILMQAYDSNAIVRAVANQRMAQSKLYQDKRVAVEEALVEMYAALKSQHFDEFKQRYGVAFPIVPTRNFLNKILDALKNMVARVLGKPVAFSNQQIMDLLAKLDRVDLRDVPQNHSGSLNSQFDLDETHNTQLKILDLVDEVMADKTIRKQLDLMPVSATEIQEAGKYGLDLNGYTHLIDSSAINHILKNHGNSKREQARGQIAIDKYDIANLPEIIQNPDTVVYGLKNDIGRDLIVSIKQMGDSVVVLEEVRSGRKKVALNSMRKYPRTVHATSVLKSLYPTSATLSENAISVVHNPQSRNGQVQQNQDNNPNIDDFDDVQFDLADTDTPQQRNRAMNNLIQAVSFSGSLKELKQRAGGKWTDMLKISLQALGRRQIVDIYGKILPQLKAYDNLVDKFGADGNKAAIRADELVIKWGRLKDADQLAALMHEATIAQVDADPLKKSEVIANRVNAENWLTELDERIEKAEQAAAAEVDEKELKKLYAIWQSYEKKLAKLEKEVADFEDETGNSAMSVTDDSDVVIKVHAEYSFEEAQEVRRKAIKAEQDYADLRDKKERGKQELAHLKQQRQQAEERYHKMQQAENQLGEFNQRFNQLSQEAQDVYRQARDDYKAHFEAVQQAMKERMERMGVKKSVFGELEEKFAQALSGVYFPLARFGSYVVVRDEKNKVVSVSRAETLNAAEKLQRDLTQQFSSADGFTVAKPMLSKEYVRNNDGVGRAFMDKLRKELHANANLSQAQYEYFEDALSQLYMQSLPDLSWAKHGIHRKNRAGFSHDARRAYAQSMSSGASYLAKLRYADLLENELQAMQDHADKMSGKSEHQPVVQRVVDEMVKRHDNMMNPNPNALSTGLTSFGFLWYMGLSPASAVVNLSQTALVAYPMMAAKWGWDKAGAELLRASRETHVIHVNKGARKAKNFFLSKDDTGNDWNDISGSLNADELAAYQRAVDEGVIDISQAHDLAGIANGEDSGVMWKFRGVMRAASGLFHHAERFNRQVTFVAAYRLAKQNNAEDAFAEAKKMTYDSHFDYATHNRPRFMQGNVARVVFLFKQYSQNMIYTLARTAHQMILAEDKDKRPEMRRAFAGLLTAHAAAAGVLGLPMVTTLLAVASWLFSDDDEPWDAEVALRNTLAEVFGDKGSELISRGLSRATPWDISGRVGLNNLIFPDVQEGLEGKRWAESFAAGLAGPVVGLGINWANGAQKLGQGDWAQALEAFMPVAIRNPLKSIRFAQDGLQDSSGVMIQDDFNVAELVGQGLGFSPSSSRLAQETKSAVYQMDRQLARARTDLIEQFAKAQMRGDHQTAKAVREKINQWNSKHPTRKITVPQLIQSIRNRQKRINESKNGIYLPSNRSDARSAGNFGIGE